MTDAEIAKAAPNVMERAYLYRPTPGFADPPLCTLHELRTVYTLDDLADFHEILDYNHAAKAKANRAMKRRAEAGAAKKRPR